MGILCSESNTAELTLRILEMASSTNLGDEARKDNAGAHITLPEVWGSGALFCSYKPQPSCTLAHTCVYRLPGTQSRAPL